MSSLLSRAACQQSKSDVLPPHVAAMIRERQRRLAAILRYDRYIAQAAGDLAQQGFWRNIKRQDVNGAQRLKKRLKNWLDCPAGLLV